MDGIASNYIIKKNETSERRLDKKITKEILEKINKYQSYIGLEMIIDTVNSIETNKLELYLNNLKKNHSHEWFF
ncbi:hypothetical protein [Flavobacterium psychrophilum]|uniref:hypothetical protein n=1 Tax=Flavobacterium psychrophilum TaxID=96345 RepID=UPI000B7C0BF3|nr:hypothetical protein [Flavobacterium psychrophilum]SNA79347.1 conserved hypothetical protein [Flavobacterium psychrophilum]